MIVQTPSPQILRRADQELFPGGEDFDVAAVLVDDEHQVGQGADHRRQPAFAAL